MKPYTYLIGWPEFDRWYYGVRYARNCDPSDFWNPYQTSSQSVKSFIQEHGDPSIKLIRKTFDNAKSARLWENRVLKRMKVVDDGRWLNKTDNVAIAPLYGSDHPHFGKKGPEHHSYGKKNKLAADAQKRRWANPDNKNPMRDPDIVAKKVAKTSGNKHHMKRPEVAEKVSGKNNWIYQKPGALEERKKQFIEMNKARKGTHYRRLCCAYCGNDYASVQIKQHEHRCEMNLSSSIGNTDKAVYNNLVGKHLRQS